MRILDAVIRLVEHEAAVPPEQKAWFENTGKPTRLADLYAPRLTLPLGDDPVSTTVRENLNRDPHYYDEPPLDPSKGAWI